MSSNAASLSFACRQCGNELVWPGNIADDSTEIACQHCRELLGTCRDLRDKAIVAVRAHVEKMFHDGFMHPHVGLTIKL